MIAAPVFARVAEQSLSYLDILPKGSLQGLATAQLDMQPLPDLAPLLPESEPVDGLRMPDFRGMSYRQVLQAMQNKSLNLKLSGSGQVVEQSPAPGRTIRYGKEAWVRFGA